MAGLRLYLGADAEETVIAPTPYSEWEDTSLLVRARCTSVRRSLAKASITFDDADETSKDILFRQYVSDELTAGQTITGGQELRAQVLVQRLGGFASDMRLTVGARVLASDGTTERKLLSSLLRSTDLAAEATLTNSRWAQNSEAGDYETQAGDRLVLEFGMGGDPGAGNTHKSRMRFGDTDGTNLPIDNTTTADNDPWFFFTQNLTFVPLGHPCMRRFGGMKNAGRVCGGENVRMF